MNCEQARERLELSFGIEELTQEIADHLEDCAACRLYHVELSRLADRLGSDGDFGLDPQTIDQAVKSVEDKLDSPDKPAIVPLVWMKHLTRVAAALFVLSVSYGAYLVGQRGALVDQSHIADSGQTAIVASVVSLNGDADEELDEDMITILIEDFGSAGYFKASEIILDDLTDEEMKYLEDNLNVGDLL